jgi:hypothetical protein
MILSKCYPVHLKEEEEEIPCIARRHYTKADEDAMVQKMLASHPFSELRDVFPAVLEGIDEWATPEYKKEFLSAMPGLLVYLVNNYFVPDYGTYIAPKRDAPFFDRGNKPILTKKNCLGVFFCCKCII